MSKFDAAYTNKIYGLGETVDHDEAIVGDLKSHLEAYIQWRPIDEEDTTERVFYDFKDMLERVKPELSRFLEPTGGPQGGDVMDSIYDHIEDKIGEAGMSPKVEAREETGRIPFGKGLEPAETGMRAGQGEDEDRSYTGKVTVDEFEKELVDLYWSVVDSGIDENLAGNWFDGVRLSLSELLDRNDDPDLQDLGSKF